MGNSASIAWASTYPSGYTFEASPMYTPDQKDSQRDECTPFQCEQDSPRQESTTWDSTWPEDSENNTQDDQDYVSPIYNEGSPVYNPVSPVYKPVSPPPSPCYSPQKPRQQPHSHMITGHQLKIQCTLPDYTFSSAEAWLMHVVGSGKGKEEYEDLLRRFHLFRQCLPHGPQRRDHILVRHFMELQAFLEHEVDEEEEAEEVNLCPKRQKVSK
jgi:hypothetical protein